MIAPSKNVIRVISFELVIIDIITLERLNQLAHGLTLTVGTHRYGSTSVLALRKLWKHISTLRMLLFFDGTERAPGTTIRLCRITLTVSWRKVWGKVSRSALNTRDILLARLGRPPRRNGYSTNCIHGMDVFLNLIRLGIALGRAPYGIPCCTTSNEELVFDNMRNTSDSRKIPADSRQIRLFTLVITIT